MERLLLILFCNVSSTYPNKGKLTLHSLVHFSGSGKLEIEAEKLL